jgi:hypothetical protein
MEQFFSALCILSPLERFLADLPNFLFLEKKVHSKDILSPLETVLADLPNFLFS